MAVGLEGRDGESCGLPRTAAEAGGAPDRIRTCGLRLRRPTLYPAELRAQTIEALGTKRWALVPSNWLAKP